MSQPLHYVAGITLTGADATGSDALPPALRPGRPAAELLQVAQHYWRPDLLVISVEGDLDLATAPLLHQVLTEPLPELTVLDLTGVSFLALAGLRALETAAARARLEHRRMGLVVAHAQVRRLLRLFAFDVRVPVFPNLAEAVRALPMSALTGPHAGVDLHR